METTRESPWLGLVYHDLALARETASHAASLEQPDGFTFSTGLARRALGRTAVAWNDLGEARSHLSQALAAFQRCGAAFEAAQTRTDLAAPPASRTGKA